LIGRPTANRLIQAVNSSLPQPFAEGSDAIERQTGEVVFRLPEGFSLGVVQALSSPYNASRAIVVITGTTDEGVAWSRRAMTDLTLVGQLTGDLAYIQDTLIQSFTSELLTQATLAQQTLDILPEMQPEGEDVSPPLDVTPAATNLAPTPEGTLSIPAPYQPVPAERPVWLNGLTLGVGVIVLAVLGFVLVRSRRKRDEP
jgi:hypothetical protein